MFCTRCGKQLNGYELFCTFCGAKVEPDWPVAGLSETEATASPISGPSQPRQSTTAQSAPPIQPIIVTKSTPQGQPIAAQQSAPENHLRRQIKRVSRNRMILFGILSIYFSPMFLIFFTIALFSLFSPAFAGSMSYAPSELIAGLIVMGLPGIIFPVKFIQAVISYLNYTKCSAYKKLGSFAGLLPDEFNYMQRRDMSTPLLFSHKKLTLTGHWVFIHSRFSLRIFPSAKLVWVYMKQHTTLDKNTMREISSYNYAVFEFSDGGRRSVRASSQICQEMLIGTAESYPQVLVGYTDENKRLYSNMTPGITISSLLKRGEGMDNINT